MTLEDRAVELLMTARDDAEQAATLLQEHYPYAAAVVRSAVNILRTEVKFFERRQTSAPTREGNENPDEPSDGAGRVDKVSDVRTVPPGRNR